MFYGYSKKAVNVDGLYNYAKTNNQTLFPTEEYDFWAGYEANYQKFDRYFYQKYRAFKVCQEYDAAETSGDVLADWKQIIDAHLFINAKRYSELYKVQVLAADAYDIVNNYDLTEEYSRDNTGTQTMAEGARQDSTQYGQKQNTNQYGQKQITDAYAQRTDTNNTTLGQQTSTSTEKRSAFNSSGLQNVAGGDIQNGQRQDSATLINGAHNDTHTEAQSTDTLTEAQHTDTISKGAQSNTRTDALKEIGRLHRYGNIGIQTAGEIISKHINLWDAFRFYQMIFDEIALNYLVIDVDFDFATTQGTGGGGGGGDAELLQAIRELSAQLTAAQLSINGNVDAAETAIRGDISTQTGTIQQYIVAATTAVGGQITTSTAQIRGDILEVITDGY